MSANAEPLASARKEEILLTATALFAEHGFHAVGMRAIADAVGIRSSSLYHYYQSKMDLLEAIARNATGTFVSAHLSQLEEPGSRPQRMHAVVYAHITYFWQHRLQVVVGLRELKELEPKRRKELNKLRLSYQHALTAVIEEGARAGDFKVEDPALATYAVLNMVNGVNDWFQPGGRLTLEDVATSYADYAVYGILGARRPRKR
jgi:AcrR family transcriptional regulator